MDPVIRAVMLLNVSAKYKLCALEASMLKDYLRTQMLSEGKYPGTHAGTAAIMLSAIY